MNPHASSFFRQFAGAVTAALIPVLLIAFLTVPFNLGGHPGEARMTPMPSHMT